MKTVLLTSGTVGYTTDNPQVGETVLVSLHDENGCPLKENGIVSEILEDDGP